MSTIEKSERREKVYKDRKFWKESHGRDDIHLLDVKLKAFLNKNVNKPYDKAYAEWCSMYPAIILGDVDTRRWFKMNFGNRWSKYYVDEGGFIRKKPKKKNHNKDIVVGYRNNGKIWKINEEIWNWPECLLLLENTIGTEDVELLKKRKYRVPQRLVLPLLSIEERMIGLVKAHRLGIFDFPQKKWFMRLKDDEEPIYVKKGSDDYRKIICEEKKRYKRARSDDKKKKEEYNSNLLSSIAEAERIIGRKDDKIVRERNGFDEDSFKGDFYHGRKGKKKNLED